MIIGIPKEIKNGEFRVSLTPAAAKVLRDAKQTVWVETDAGERSGFHDAEYRRAGAKIVSAAKAWSADLVVKVKEPQLTEFKYFRPKLTLFTFLHLAPNRKLVDALLKKKVTAIAYETIEENGRLPILEPMSEVAGRSAVLIGSFYQSNSQGGSGMLITGMPGILPAHVVILGGGVVGENAARVAAGMGARVTILERRPERMKYLDEILSAHHVATLMADPENIRSAVSEADILVGAIHIAGSKTPQLVSRAMVKRMKPRSVIVDVAIDQGGTCETSRPTSHAEPTYMEEGILHYCVPNMPGAYGRTSTLALTNATLPYIQAIHEKGIPGVFRDHPALAKGLQCQDGQLLSKPVATAQGR